MPPAPKDHNPSASTRTETDIFGPIEVPADRYWGAQTQRSRQNFKIGGERMPMPLIHALARQEGRGARPTCELGLLDARAAPTPSSRRREEVIAGKLDDHFPLVVWQTGSGTQTNMNVNEVIANRAIEMLGGDHAAPRRPVHPNDHVNLGQSSNDTFPTAMHIAAAEEIDRPAAARRLPASTRALERQGGGVRGHRQDRPHPSAGRDAAHARPGILRLCGAGATTASSASKPRCTGCMQLAQGGTAVGTGLNTPAGFAERFAAKIAEMTGLPFVTAPQQVRGAGRPRRDVFDATAR